MYSCARAFRARSSAGAGAEAGFPDAEYEEKGARILSSRAEIFGAADVVCYLLKEDPVD